MSQMLKSSGAMAAATLTSRLLGMVREMVYARFMGDRLGQRTPSNSRSPIPNLFRRLLGEGALTAAFIPIFKEKEKTHGETEMWRAANAVISGLGHRRERCRGARSRSAFPSRWRRINSTPKPELMLRLLRVMFPYMLLVCVAAAFMGMLNARGHFFIPAMGATMLNVVMIALRALACAEIRSGTAEGIATAGANFRAGLSACWRPGAAQAAFQLPTLWRDGFRYRWVSPWRNETVRRVIYTNDPRHHRRRRVSNQRRAGPVARASRSAPAIVSSFNVRRAADGIAPGHVRHFAGDVFAADAYPAWQRKKITRNFAPPCGTACAR